MADFYTRHPFNVQGRVYVDGNCIDCDACRATAPELFRRDDETGCSYVYEQPRSPEEMAVAQECIEGCCVGAIGSDGYQHDWKNSPRYGWDHPFPEDEWEKYNHKLFLRDERAEEEASRKRALCCRNKRRRPWWKFW